jgi:hypothetical protein
MAQPLALRYGSTSHVDAPKREARFAPINGIVSLARCVRQVPKAVDLRRRYIAPNQDCVLDVGLILENRYQRRRVRYSTLREPRLIKIKFSERVVRGARAARPKRAPTVADVA